MSSDCSGGDKPRGDDDSTDHQSKWERIARHKYAIDIEEAAEDLVASSFHRLAGRVENGAEGSEAVIGCFLRVGEALETYVLDWARHEAAVNRQQVEALRTATNFLHNYTRATQKMLRGEFDEAAKDQLRADLEATDELVLEWTTNGGEE